MADVRELKAGQQVWWHEDPCRVEGGTVVIARNRQVVVDTPGMGYMVVQSSWLETEKGPVLARVASRLLERAKHDQETAAGMMLHLAEIARVDGLAASTRSAEPEPDLFRL